MPLRDLDYAVRGPAVDERVIQRAKLAIEDERVCVRIVAERIHVVTVLQLEDGILVLIRVQVADDHGAAVPCASRMGVQPRGYRARGVRTALVPETGAVTHVAVRIGHGIRGAGTEQP